MCVGERTAVVQGTARPLLRAHMAVMVLKPVVAIERVLVTVEAVEVIVAVEVVKLT